MTVFVSLFRGINVGGNQMVRMDALKELHEALGLRDVVTYIQSGNVVFSADDADPASLSQQIENGFAEKLGFRVPVMLRTSAELREIITHNPFQNAETKEPKRMLVLFLAARPPSTALEELRQAYNGPEELCLIGQELYVYFPDGVGHSKLTSALMERKLKTVGTGRNWNTILQLQKLMIGVTGDG